MKRIAAVLFALILSVGFALTLAACGDNGSISEVGKTYSVKDYKTDVNFVFDDPSKAPANLDSQKLSYSTMRISFKENNAVSLFLHAEMPVDDWHFYAINSENRVEFYETEQDAKNMTNRLSADYFGWNYQFDSNKKTLTVSARNDESGVTISMVLTANA